ncbi:acetyl-CoA carboxylase biotin carboxyl carrier protein subunit [Pedobacter sp. HMWF019]|uniref:acetyl-CoA carboxylase biotin carboxyl carrier protein subunit n=1 Tax=Pedobacter sp. HMWF019 TaxID=2056856 RepID=UPI000D333271|nr:acetyl-CoA carboxylase biotin carboxyl carrier protein subunit [Pedobacter sp. HMWF019]PTT03956.1 acetyl-CoA carboxylase biotin carboxyl carrier protein subunit [Pedobacter sp. HMWF019]
MYKVKVNDQYSFEIEAEQEGLKVNGEVLNIDRAVLTGGHTHVIYKDRSYRVEMVSEDREAKQAELKVNGRIYLVKIEDQFDQLLKQLGMDNLSANKVQEIKAPMPGLVLNVLVTEGQEVKKGDSLLVLEAMKMENIIKSTTDGVVKRIAVKHGEKVDKNAVLLQFS